MGLSELWTLIALILHFVGVGDFAKWAVIDWPWHWSCLCIEIWAIILYLLIALVCGAIGLISLRK